MVICLERGAHLHMAQLMPLPLTVSCFSKIQIGFAFLVPAHPGSPGQRAVKRVCVCVCVWLHRLILGHHFGHMETLPTFSTLSTKLMSPKSGSDIGVLSWALNWNSIYIIS